MRVHRRRRWVASVVCILLALGAAAAIPTTAEAVGSGQIYPSTSSETCTATTDCRAGLEWRTGAYGPTATGETQVRRRTLFTVFAKAGERIVLGSSSVGVGQGDALIWNPGVITDTEAATLPTVVDGTNGFSCVAQRTSSGSTGQGVITTRAKELAGAQSVDGTVNTTGYVPCSYVAPSTGLYRVAFTGSAGFSSNVDGTPTADVGTSSTTFPTTLNMTSVSAFDVGVRPNVSTAEGPASEITGRVLTYVYAGFTGTNPRPVTLKLYLTTLDGYRYAVDTRKFDPNGFVLYGNRTGFENTDGSPLDHDVRGSGSTPQLLSTTVGGTHLAAPEYPLSFEPLASETLTALGIPSTAVEPDLQPISFSGTSGNTSYLGKGGTFTFSTGSAGTYQIVISRNGTNFDPGLTTNKVLRAYVAAGSHTVTWDGTDNSLDPFPVGQNYAVRAILRVGEYHAPMIDVESAYYGSPSMTLLNPPNGICPFSGDVSTGTNCTRAFYDDRGYTTSSNVDVGTPGGSLCVSGFTGKVPSPLFADPVTGFDSTSTQRAFGVQTQNNANVDCPSAGAGTFGDSKGLDLWTYFPSALRTTTLNVVAIPAAPTASADTASTPVNTTVSRDAAGGALANDTGTNITVTAHGTAAHGTLTLNADGSWSYTPSPGWSGVETIPYTITDDAGQTASSTLTITVTPTAAPDTATTAVDTAVTVAASTILANDVGTGLTLTSVGTPTGGGTVALDANGDVVYTPPAGVSGIGADTFSYVATDSAGTTVSSTVTVTITPQAVDDTYTAHAAATLTVPAATGLLANDLGSGLQVTGTGTAAHGTVTGNADGSFSYTPTDPDYSGPDQFTYAIEDSSGQTSSAVARLTVLPVANADTASTPVNTAVARTAATGVLANDHGTGLTVTLHGSAAHGTLTLNADGSWNYTPDTGWSGVETIAYTITDSSGATAESTLTITVAPTATDDSASTVADTPVTVSAAIVIANDLGDALTVTAVGAPAHGSAAVASDGTVTYTPAAGFSGVDRVPYTVTDSAGSTASAAIVIMVAPHAVADAYTATSGTALTVSASSGLLADDSGTGLSVTASGSPAHGTVAVAADGSFVYTPASGFTGTDSFVYTITDAAGGTSTATVTITVVAVASTALTSSTAATALATTGAAGVVPGLVGGATAIVLGLALLLLRRRRPVAD